MYSLHKISVSFLFIFLSLSATAADPYRFAAGAGEAGTGYVCAAKSGFWSSFHNQALLGLNKSTMAGISYESRFNIKELGTRTAGVIIPAGRSSLGATYSHFGYADFRREAAGLACGIALDEKISAGVEVNYFTEKSSGEYDNRQFITFQAGILVSATENILIGIHVFNPLPNSIRKNHLPLTINAGAGINLNKVLFAGIETEMSSGSNLSIKAGFEYEVADRFWFRGGFVTENSSFSFGIGYLLKSVHLDAGFSTHERLGITSSVSLIFKIR